MLSDEEKKAIERLNKRYEFFKENPLATNVWLTLDIHNLGIALNLIEKQSKEIEGLIKVSKECIEEKFNNDQKWEDKIKARIKEIQNMYDELPKNPKEHLHTKTECLIVIGELQSLLEKE